LLSMLRRLVFRHIAKETTLGVGEIVS
jgi:hypothetical protein